MIVSSILASLPEAIRTNDEMHTIDTEYYDQDRSGSVNFNL